MPYRVNELTVQHNALTRRYFMRIGLTGLVGAASTALGRDDSVEQALADAIASLEYLTSDEKFGTVERGNPLPYKLPEDKRRAVGLDRETWKLEVVADAESGAKIERPLTRAAGTALDFAALEALAERAAVRFLKVITCNNVDGPLGMGLWEGVPLREVIWRTRPTADIRRVYYYGYHNDDPRQMFRASLSLNRVLEDPPGGDPVILCTRLNGRWLSGKRGGPVRMLVPETYGYASIKWLQRVVLTNNFLPNDTYAEQNNDIGSWLKTCARFVKVPATAPPGTPIPITGLAQVGTAGLSRVQYLVLPESQPPTADDPHFGKTRWTDAEVLPPPILWGGGLMTGKLPRDVRHFDRATGKPSAWPLPNTVVHWAGVLRDLPPGQYALRCRTIDAAGNAQPLPRPLPKSGRNTIQKVGLVVG